MTSHRHALPASIHGRQRHVALAARWRGVQVIALRRLVRGERGAEWGRYEVRTLESIGLAENFSPYENIWDLTGANTHRRPAFQLAVFDPTACALLAMEPKECSCAFSAQLTAHAILCERPKGLAHARCSEQEAGTHVLFCIHAWSFGPTTEFYAVRH